jgi:hypothetical protein
MVSTTETTRLTQKDVLDWACKKSSQELNKRVDELLSIIMKGGPEEHIEMAKFEVAEISRIILKRG